MLAGLPALGEPGLVVVDIGTGSGVLARELARLLPGARVVATDVNPHAVREAHRLLGGEALVVECDGASCLRGFHAAIANLPYLPVEPEEDGCGGYLSLAWAAGRRGERALRLCLEASRAERAAALVYSTLTPADIRGCLEARGFRVVRVLERPGFFERIVAVVAERWRSG